MAPDYPVPVNGLKILMVGVAATALLAACSDDDSLETIVPPTTPSTVVVSATPPRDTSSTILVTATDYRFGGLPTAAPAGSTFAFQNASTKEAHEMIITRIPDDETRTVGELLALPEGELEAMFSDAPPALVMVASPGEVGTTVEGAPTITEPGRYAVLCFVPVGADPDDVAAGTAGDGPPHIMEGMYAEITLF